jgi:hypothetical protein
MGNIRKAENWHFSKLNILAKTKFYDLVINTLFRPISELKNKTRHVGIEFILAEIDHFKYEYLVSQKIDHGRGHTNFCDFCF